MHVPILLCLVLCAMGTMVRAQICTGYANPMTADGKLSYKEKFALIVTATLVHCRAATALAAECENFVYLANQLDENWYRDGSCIMTWRITSYNDSMCHDPWAPDLERASSVMAPVFLSTYIGWSKVWRHSTSNNLFTWERSHELLMGYITRYCMQPTTDDPQCQWWECHKGHFAHTRYSGPWEKLVALWVSIAADVHGWEYDAWASSSYPYVRELFAHAKFIKLQAGTTWWGSLFSSSC